MQFKNIPMWYLCAEKLCKKIISLFSMIKALYLHNSRNLYMFSKNAAVHNMWVWYLSCCVSSSIPWYCMVCTPQSDGIRTAKYTCVFRASTAVKSQQYNMSKHCWKCLDLLHNCFKLIFGHCIVLSLLLLSELLNPHPITWFHVELGLIV